MPQTAAVRSTRTKRPVWHIGGLAAAGLLLVACSVFVITKLGTSHATVSAESASQTIQWIESGAPPTAEQIANYTVAPTAPRYLRVPGTDDKARIVPVNANPDDSSINTPNNAFDAGWVQQSAVPGSLGAALIAGHMSTAATNAVFVNLAHVTPGTYIQVEQGNGTLLNYRVVEANVSTANSIDMIAAATPVTKDVQGLNIITGIGNVLPGTNEYDSRLLIRAERVD